jgi:hypothetical protein
MSLHIIKIALSMRQTRIFVTSRTATRRVIRFVGQRHSDVNDVGDFIHRLRRLRRNMSDIEMLLFCSEIIAH